jgi:hypothetical protein
VNDPPKLWLLEKIIVQLKLVYKPHHNGLHMNVYVFLTGSHINRARYANK